MDNETFQFVKDFSLYGKDPDGKMNKFLQELYFHGGTLVSSQIFSSTQRILYEWTAPEPLDVEGVGLELFTPEEVKTYGQS